MADVDNRKNAQKIIAYLMDKWKGNPCPMCKREHAGWSVDDNVFELRKFHGGKLVIGGGPILPIVPVTCNNCGNTVFINAIKAEIVDTEPKKEGEKNE